MATRRTVTALSRSEIMPILALAMRNMAMFMMTAALLSGCASAAASSRVDSGTPEGTFPAALSRVDSGTPGGTSPAASSRVDSGTPVRAFSASCLPHLPDPNVWRVNLTTLSRDEKTRKDEVCQYLADRYRREGWKIKVTIQMPSGDIIDWIDSGSVPGAQAQPPPLLSTQELQPAPGAQLGKTELDIYSELRGPPGTFPAVRSTFAPYISGDTGATSVDDFVTHHQVP